MPHNAFSAGPYTFRPATHHDLAGFRGWLQTPEVIRWWGDPDEQYAILEGDLSEPGMRMWVVEFDGFPFAYVQDYEVHTWPQPHFAHLPAGTRGVDAFIGEPDLLGLGHGSAFLRHFAEHLRAEGAPVVVIDPDPANVRARRAYENAGFVAEAGHYSAEAGALLMTFGTVDAP